MIRTISAGEGINISGNIYNAPYIDTTKPSAGLVRYTNDNLEVYDGSSWLPLHSSYPQIEISDHVKAILAWAQDKIAEEERLKELAAHYPTVADALIAKDRAQEALCIAVTLCDIK